MKYENLEGEIKKAIIERLGLDLDPESIDNDAPLFAKLTEGTEFEEVSMNLDSIDILEIVLALNNEFDLDITDDNYEIFTSIKTLADYIRTCHPEE